MDKNITTKNIDDFLIDKDNFNFYFFRAMNRDVIENFITSQSLGELVQNDGEENIGYDFLALPLNQRFKIIDRLFNLTALDWFNNIAKHEEALERIVVGAGKKETIRDILNTRKKVLDNLMFCKELVLFIFDDQYGDNGLMLNAELCCTPPYTILPNYLFSTIGTPHYLRNIIQVYKEN